MKPIDYILERVRALLPEFGANAPQSLSDCVLIIRAMTGSGKSTTMPVELYRLFNPKINQFKKLNYNYFFKL